MACDEPCLCHARLARTYRRRPFRDHRKGRPAIASSERVGANPVLFDIITKNPVAHRGKWPNVPFEGPNEGQLQFQPIALDPGEQGSLPIADMALLDNRPRS